MHYFIDHLISLTQDATQVFGPDSSDSDNKYNLTCKFQLSSDAKAFACQDGLLIVQDSPSAGSDFVNVIIKPLSALFNSNYKIAYFIYRGILRNTLLSLDGTSIVSNDATSNNELISRIYASDATKTNYSSGYLGYSSTPVDNSISIDSIFYSTGSIQPIKIKEGDWFGNYGAGSIGFDIVLESDKLNIDVGIVQSSNVVVDVSSLTDPYQIQVTRENILGFMDAAALFGIHYNSGVSISTYDGTTKTTSTLTGQDIYNTLLINYYSKNFLYIDIRSERGYSYNFSENYDDGTGNNIQIGQTDSSLVTQEYITNSWPILIITANDNPIGAELFIQLRVDDNVNPVLYDLNWGIGNSDFNDAYNDVNTWTNTFSYQIPTVGTSSKKTSSNRFANVLDGDTDALNIAYYLKSYYFRAQPLTTTSDTQESAQSDNVLYTQKYYHNAFCPVDLVDIGSQTLGYNKIESSTLALIDEPLQANTGTGGFSFLANNKIIWDTDKVLFYSNLLNSKISSNKKFHPTNPQKITTIKTEVDGFFNSIDIICKLYYKVLPDGSSQAINVIGVNNNTTSESADKESALFVGISLQQFNSMRDYARPQFANLAHYWFYLERSSSYDLYDSKSGDRFFEYILSFQGVDANGKATIITPTFPDPVTLNPEPVYVYTRDNLFFCSIDFSASEKVSDGGVDIEYYINSVTDTHGYISNNDNIDLALVVGLKSVSFYYIAAPGELKQLIGTFDTVLSTQMANGVILGPTHKKPKIDIPNDGSPPIGYLLKPDYTIIKGYNSGINIERSFVNKSTMDVVSVGHFKPPGASVEDSNYQLYYQNKNKRVVLIYLDKNITIGDTDYGVVLPTPYTGKLKYKNTYRRYAQVGVAGIAIALLIEAKIDVITCGGLSLSDSTCFPSQTHPNGAAMDMCYVKDNQGTTIDTTNLEDLPDTAIMNNVIRIMAKYGLKTIYKGLQSRFATLSGATGFAGHNDHLHGGNYQQQNP
jgi:hypothetical protein